MNIAKRITELLEEAGGNRKDFSKNYKVIEFDKFKMTVTVCNSMRL